jgi:protoheme IX farnesyltransferase
LKSIKTQSVKWSDELFARIKDLGLLVKFKLSLLVVLTSFASYAIVAAGSFSWVIASLLMIGGFLVTFAANALNQVLEKDFDKLMDRTKVRPLVTGNMKPSTAVLIAGIFSLIGVTCLSIINPLTGLLSMISLLIYAFVYTPVKRHSTLAVAIGAIPGALPMMIGCTAFTGSITYMAIILFAIQFLWQFPHFWAIGYIGKEDYDRAGFKLLPIEDGKIDRKLGLHSSIYAFMLILVVASLYTLGVSLIAVVLSLILSLAYFGFSLNFHFRFNRKSALGLMFSSFIYLPLILIILLIF